MKKGMVFDGAHIDHGKDFDWGRASQDYGKYRDIYPEEFYQKMIELGLCTEGQKVLDLGTGTGVLPRHLYRFGAHFTACDAAENQIKEAKRLSEEAGMHIDYVAAPTEALNFPNESFDVVTACQCFFYFDQKVVLPKIAAMLKPGGKLAILYMVWLPEECTLAKKSEELVLRYNPQWTGAGAVRQTPVFPEQAKGLFTLDTVQCFDCQLPFTAETWNGRIKACRGIGASSLSQEEKDAFETEHLAMLRQEAPSQFTILHHVTMLILQKT